MKQKSIVSLLLLLALLLGTIAMFGCDGRKKEENTESTYGGSEEYTGTDVNPDVCDHVWKEPYCPLGEPYCALCNENYWDQFHDYDWTDPCLGVCACGETYTSHNYDYTNHPCIGTCRTCGETQEDSYYWHDWSAATCTVAETCKDCGKTGEKASHKWIAATCTAPKTCKLCGEVGSEALGHTTQYKCCELDKECLVCKQVIEATAHEYAEIGGCVHCGKIEGFSYLEAPPIPYDYDAGYNRHLKIISWYCLPSWVLQDETAVVITVENASYTADNFYISWNVTNRAGYVIDSGHSHTQLLAPGDKCEISLEIDGMTPDEIYFFHFIED